MRWNLGRLVGKVVSMFETIAHAQTFVKHPDKHAWTCLFRCIMGDGSVYVSHF
jgi:hypothetical protein